jgi:hypothetical protein
MTKNSRLDFSPVTPFRSRFLRGGDSRLMLGLTARRIRNDRPTFLGATAPLTVSGLSPSTSVLDRLRTPLTRYHD